MQFATTSIYHFPLVPLTIGLAVLTAIRQTFRRCPPRLALTRKLRWLVDRHYLREASMTEFTAANPIDHDIPVAVGQQAGSTCTSPRPMGPG
jgi:hypothetical protein